MTRKHLSGLFARLFAEFTGLHFHIAWAPSLPHDWTAQTLPTGCSVCCRLAGTSIEPQGRCLSCGPRQLARTLSTDGDGHCFTCHLGVRNFWLAIHVRGVTVGIAYLQALERADREGPDRKRLGRADATVVNRAEFDRAGRLLRLIIQHVQIMNLAELRMADLTNARHAVAALEVEQAHLRKELGWFVPQSLQTSAVPVPVPETHAEQVVRRLLEFVQRNYAQPITLQRCAVALAMNAAYLSALFSRAVGMPFKTYLTELRLAKARELLGDPARSISEVAGAVGYASENRFRSAFKKFSGLSPRLWRETFDAVKLALLGWLLQEQGLFEAVEALLA